MTQWEEDPECDDWHETYEGLCGFTMMYCGGGSDEAGYCGVELTEIDTCANFKLSDITKFTASPEQDKEARKLIAKLHPELRALCPDELDYWVIWSTS